MGKTAVQPRYDPKLDFGFISGKYIVAWCTESLFFPLFTMTTWHGKRSYDCHVDSHVGLPWDDHGQAVGIYRPRGPYLIQVMLCNFQVCHGCQALASPETTWSLA